MSDYNKVLETQQVEDQNNALLLRTDAEEEKQPASHHTSINQSYRDNMLSNDSDRNRLLSGADKLIQEANADGIE